jgi:hypothetical protein
MTLTTLRRIATPAARTYYRYARAAFAAPGSVATAPAGTRDPGSPSARVAHA